MTIGKLGQSVPKHPMPILMTFEKCDACIRLSVLDASFFIMLNCFLVTLTETLVYEGVQIEFLNSLQQKSDKIYVDCCHFGKCLYQNNMLP